ncbi:hypothetical protein [Neobacillus massiliamazoniensis]|uniref:hypothetical protein n=1 Tax=Neobacillus massiliamazoniensis TaxID=1499688 RepID=UPI000AEA3227|nr:hypothetical protein [Neobacillus massiliamazoniensis]
MAKEKLSSGNSSKSQNNAEPSLKQAPNKPKNVIVLISILFNLMIILGANKQEMSKDKQVAKRNLIADKLTKFRDSK